MSMIIGNKQQIRTRHITSNECVRIICHWTTTIPSEQPRQTQPSRDKKRTKENRLGGSPLFDMVRVTGLELKFFLFVIFRKFRRTV